MKLLNGVLPWNDLLMPGRITIKRAVKRSTGWSALMTHLLSGNLTGPAACILYYHRVAEVDFIDPRIDDHNVLPEVFERQIAALSEFAEIVPLPELPERLIKPAAKPLVCLTFDDGYANFFSDALPVLKRYNAPATLCVVTGIIGSTDPAPFDKWAVVNSDRVTSGAWRPLNWDELEKCVASGLVTIGAHSHRHLRANESAPDQIWEEVFRSSEILRSRFGAPNVNVYAYPYGNSYMGHVPTEYESAVRKAGFKMALTTDFGHVAERHNPFRLPRVEAHGIDTAGTLRAKVQSKRSPFYLHDYCRAAVYRLRNDRRGKPADSQTEGQPLPAAAKPLERENINFSQIDV